MPGEPAVDVDVRELRDLSRRLKGVGKDAQRELRDELVKIGDRLVIHVKGRVPVRTGRARASVRVRKAQAGVRLAGGGTSAPHYPWLDFGGSTKVDGPRGRVHRPFIAEGRYIFPTVADQSDEIERDVEAAMQKVARKHGLDLR